jgi:hypothetical protein
MPHRPRRRRRNERVDRWESEEAFRSFRARFAEEFERLDSEGERLTLEETPLGEFEPGDIDRPVGAPDPDIRPQRHIWAVRRLRNLSVKMRRICAAEEESHRA